MVRALLDVNGDPGIALVERHRGQDDILFQNLWRRMFVQNGLELFASELKGFVDFRALVPGERAQVYALNVSVRGVGRAAGQNTIRNILTFLLEPSELIKL